MPASRLTDRQKSELVERYRGGEATQPLALAYDCSPNTVSRVVRAALDPQEYERLKEQRTRRSGSADAGLEARSGSREPPSQGDDAASPIPGTTLVEEPDWTLRRKSESPEAVGRDTEAAEDDLGSDEDHAGLAIDDADDFGDDDDDPLGDDDSEDSSLFVTVPPLVLAAVDAHSEIQPLPLETADLPASAYMLVDKTVELQPRPLSECSELGPLPVGEEDRQALLIFINPRAAKRLCGRTQRVIKIPDTAILCRTAPYLLAQGISRVVIEGALFSLPGS